MDVGYFIRRLINFFVGLVILILAVRVLFRLFNANNSAPFVSWIYQTSDTIMSPFRGIFPPAELQRGYVLDISALFSILVYAILGYLLLALLDSFPSRPAVVEKGTTKRRGLFR